MNTRVAAAAAALLLAASGAAAQPTAVTYQGTLASGGGPANGPHDLRFRLFTAATGGVQVGPTLCADNANVAAGSFSVQLDFGHVFATQAALHMQIEVRADTGLPCNNVTGFTTLAPLQPITSAPFAVHAKSASSLASPDGSPLAAATVDNAGNIGIGTATPGAPLHVLAPTGGATPGNALRLQGTTSTPASLAYMSFLNLGGTRLGYVGDGGGADNNINLAADSGDIDFYTQGNRVMTIKNDGNVGVGTSAPAAKLHLLGDVLAGALGEEWVLHTRSHAGGDFLQITDRDASVYQFQRGLTIHESGNVGVGVLVPQAALDVNGSIRVSPTTRWKSVHGSAFLPKYLNTPSFGTQGGLNVIDTFASANSGTVGYAGSSGPGEYFAPLELPDGAAIQYVCVDARDQHASSNIVVSVGKVSLTTGQVTEMCTTFTSGNSSSIQRPCSVFINEAVDNANNVYFLKATMNTSGSNIHWMLAARVNYVVTSPLP